MIKTKDSGASINIVMMGTSLLLWAFILNSPTDEETSQARMITLCTQQTSFQSLSITSMSSMMRAWALMIGAMMFPKLILPIQHIYNRSFKRNRFGMALFFVFGYVSVWMGFGAFIIAATSGLHLLLPGSFLPAIALGIVAVIWQLSPAKQECLNRGHRHNALAAFGWPAHRDALLFGASHGTWCVGSGWALMLLPMLLPNGHVFAMIIVTFIMLSEHLEHPKTPRWRFALRAKLFRIILAQTLISFKRIPLN